MAVMESVKPMGNAFTIILWNMFVIANEHDVKMSIIVVNVGLQNE